MIINTSGKGTPMTLFKQNIKRIFLYSVFVSFAQPELKAMTEQAADAAINETAKSGLKAIIGKAVEKGAEAEPYIGLIVRICLIVQEIKSLNFPNEKEKIEAHDVANQYGLLTAEKALKQCLMENKNTSKRARSGLPSACGEIVHVLKIFGGKKEADKLTTNYNQYRKQFSTSWW